MRIKTVIDLDEQALAAAAQELGTSTTEDTVSAALAFVSEPRRRIERLTVDPYALGVGTDIANSEIMATARR